MKYANTVTVNHSCIVNAADLENIKPGDILCNSIYSHKNDELGYDGGLDHRYHGEFWHAAAVRNIKAGRFIIKSGNGFFRYVVRKK